MQGVNIHIATPLRIPPYFLNHPVPIIDPSKNERPVVEYYPVQSQCSLSFKFDDEAKPWQFPIDTVIAISGKNNIAKRNVLKVAAADIKRRGSVKELWNQDDYEITISGVLIYGSGYRFLDKRVRELRAYCEGRKSIIVQSDIFTAYDIQRICIESYDFPHTAGLQNQMFTIKAVSDDFDKNKLLIAK
ncbi:MAG: DUF6046 domain-containing protein [Paludibacteraceae bacterium]|nr:DUF6046 domain-containing protein [Paludibacteraceae bacterium]